MASGVSDDVVGAGVTEDDSTRPDDRSPQQRFEESRVGRWVISGVIVVVLLLNVAWNLPISPVSRDAKEIVDPIAVPIGLDQWWGMFAPPDTRLASVEVDVTMANGETRIWTMQPGAPGVGWWARWMLLTRNVINTPEVRPQLAQWVVRRVVKPGERAVNVTVVLRTENLPKPGDATGGRSPASKVLYQETLAGAQ